jgi:hypothetical protein
VKPRMEVRTPYLEERNELACNLITRDYNLLRISQYNIGVLRYNATMFIFQPAISSTSFGIDSLVYTFWVAGSGTALVSVAGASPVVGAAPLCSAAMRRASSWMSRTCLDVLV